MNRFFQICIASLLLSLAFAPAQAQNEAYQRMYRSALKYNDFSTAIVALHFRLTENPDDKALKDSLASLYFTAQRYPQAISVANDLLEEDPNNQKLLEMKAIAYQSLGAVKPALESYEKLYAQSGLVYHKYQIAVLQYSLQRRGECLSTLQKIFLDGDAAEETVNINISAQQQQEVPVLAAAYNVYGVMLREDGKTEEAKQAFQKALEVYPQFVLPKGNLQAMQQEGNGGNSQPNDRTQPED